MLGSDGRIRRSDESESQNTPQGTTVSRSPGQGGSILVGLSAGLLCLCTLAVHPALAQSTGAAFCDTPLVKTLGNLFTVIQMGGPLIGGVVALGATVSLPIVRRTDLKREIKTARNQGLIWGVIVAPLATTIIQFLLQHVVVGASNCGF